MKLLGIVLAVQVALGITLVVLVATDNLPFTGDHEADGSTPRAASVHMDRFDGRPRSGSCAARSSSARGPRARPSRGGSPGS